MHDRIGKAIELATGGERVKNVPNLTHLQKELLYHGCGFVNFGTTLQKRHC